jgi:hypothetical protein
MRDSNFRRTLPVELTEDVQKYEQNPNCPCNLPIYRNVLKYAWKQLVEYYPQFDVPKVDEFIKKGSLENKFRVIDCSVDELLSKLKQLPQGRKQIAIARYQDQVTVVVNELDELIDLADNHFNVINCASKDLELKLKQLPPGRKQLAIARYEDKVTVIINDLDSF